MRRRSAIQRLARHNWEVAGRPELQGRPELYGDLVDGSWPLRVGREPWITKTRLRELGVVIRVMPMTLANEALADGVPATEILRAWADALDPQ
jgi:hypothetical protein